MNFVRIFKETIGWNHETTDWFGLTVKSTKSNNFQPFSKPLRAKQPVDSTKQHVFHLVGKTFNFKKVSIHISFRFNKRVDHTLFYPDPTHTQQQHQPFIKHLGFGFFRALDHSWSTISSPEPDSVCCLFNFSFIIFFLTNHNLPKIVYGW